MPIYGPKPKTPEPPAFPTPWYTSGTRVLDADDNFIFRVESSAASAHDDNLLARELVELVNRAARGPGYEEPRRLRVVAAAKTPGVGVYVTLAFEVSPGLFLWAGSRPEAERMARDCGLEGWPLKDAEKTFVDIETGEEITE